MWSLGRTGEAKSSFLASRPGGIKTGTVHSVFANSLNIELDGCLVHIGPLDAPLSSFGLVIARSRLRELLANCTVDTRVVYKPGRLLFYGEKRLLSLALDPLPQVDLRVYPVPMDGKAIRESMLLRLLSGIHFPALIGIPWEERTQKYARALAGKAECGNREILGYFTGRGLGLTPGGDDLLFGYTFARKLLGQEEDWVTDWERTDWSKTTKISHAYANALAKGYAGEDWIALAALMQSSGKDDAIRIISRIQSFGHTSGNDALFGFYLGLLNLSQISRR